MRSAAQQGRQLLLAVRELHQWGYERIRIAPQTADSPGGDVWQCQIVPVDLIAPGHGAVLKPIRHNELVGSFFYSSRAWRSWSRREPFVSGSAERAADWLLSECPALRERGEGADPEYARWFDMTIEQTDPDGLLIVTDLVLNPDEAITATMRALNYSSELPIAAPPLVSMKCA